MNPEREYVYRHQVEVTELNENGLLKPYAYQLIFARVADQHLSRLGLNVDFTGQFHLAWALVSLTVEIRKPVVGTMQLLANTWFSEKKGPFFRREFEFRDEEGQVRFCGTTYSVLLDLEKRTIYRKRELPFPLDPPYSELLVEAGPNYKEQHEYQPADQRVVRPSYLDWLGHVNNCRYGEFVYDVMTPQERSQLDDLQRMELYFHSEMRLDDRFGVERAKEGDCLYVHGRNHTKEDTAFYGVFRWKGEKESR
ncbi:MAG: acyl-ACP thioesterase domain-containing protein [Eubacteriales bacterium]|jgi:acyl-CoA thioesterase FadM